MQQFEWVHGAWLGMAIVLEIVANVFLKFSDGFRRKVYGVLSLAAESGSGFVAFSPLAQGLLTGRYLNGIPQDSRMAEGRSLRSDVLTDAMLTRIRGLNDLARRRGQTLAEMALAWLLSDKRVTSVIIGASSTAQIGDNLRALENGAFSDEELAEIDALSRG